MAKKAFLKDHDDIEILPITRGELVLDSSGNPAFSSNEFLATTSQPGLMSPDDKQKLANVAGNTIDTELSNTSTNPVQNKVLTQIINSIREKYLKSAVVSGNKITITDQSNNTVEFVNSTYQIVTNAVDGLVPKYDAVDGTIDAQTTDWVLTNHNGTLGWYKLPVAAFSSSSVQLFVGAKSTSNNNNSNSATTNGNTYLKLFDNSTLKNQYNIKGTGLTTVISDASGTITINTPTSHNQASSDINSLTGYSKATTISALAATDTLNTALGKLEYKADVAYNLVKGAYDGDGTIENLEEILRVLKGISDTDTIQAIVGKYLPLTGGTLTGELTLPRINIKTQRLFINTSGEWIVTDADWQTEYRLLHTGNIGNYNAGSANALTLEAIGDLNSVSDNRAFYSYFQALNRPPSNYATGISLKHPELGYKYQLVFDANGGLFTRHYTSSWQPWKTIAFTSDIPTKVSQLTNDAGYLTSASLSNYVTLNTAQTITGEKTFATNILTISNPNGGDATLKFYRGSNTAWTIVDTGGNIKFNELVSNTTRLVLYETSQGGSAVFAGSVSATGFSKSGSSDSYVLLGGGGHKLESNLSVSYASTSGRATTANMISHSTYYYDGNVMKNDTSAYTIFGTTATANYLFPSFMQAHPLWNNWADVLNFTGYCQWGGTQIATEYNAIKPRIAIRKFNQGRADWGDWTEFITSGNLTYQVGDWNSAVLSVFKSSENKINNAPTQDFCYGVHLRFHRDTANYFTDLVTTLYSDNLYYRRHTENGYSSWKRLAFISDIPTSLPANGGNADTVDNKHASEFMGCIEGSDFNPSDIVGNYVGMSTQTGISSNWTHIISLDWRGGGTASISGGANSSWETQLALPTQNRKSIYYRSFSSTAPYDWVELIDSANILSKAIGYLYIHDVRDASRAPSYFPSYTISGWFNNTGTPSTGTWYSGIHVKGWTNGYASWELCSYSSTGTANDYDLYFRNGNSSWGSWKTILNSSNVATYALKNYGADNSRPNGSTFTLPGGANVVSTRSGATSGNDIGIFYLSDDNAFICNSSDNAYLFATFDTDRTADFSTSANAAFAVLSDHAGIQVKGTSYLGKAVIYDGTNAQIILKTTTAGEYAYLAAYNTGGQYGADVVLSSGSAMVLGAGESASDMYSNNVDSLRGSENLYLTADAAVKVFTNCDTIGNRKHAVTFDTGGNTTFGGIVNAPAFTLNGASSAGTNYITGTAGRIFFGGNFHLDSLGSNATYINYYTANNVYLCSGSSQGKVGIGNASPSYKLHVTGDTYTSGWSRAASGFYVHDTGVHFTHQGTVGEIDMTSNNEFLWGSSNAELYFNYRPVSRGTTVTTYRWHAGSSSSYATHVLGKVKAQSTASSWLDGQRYERGGFNLMDATDTGSYWPWIRQTNTESSKWFSMGVLGTSLYFLGSATSRTSNGYDYGFIMDFGNGNMYAAHFYEHSDINLKKNIKAILDSDNIPVIKEFDWKSDGTHSYGLIAQELEEQGYSELVNDGGSHKTVNYSAALSLIVGKLQNKIKELEKEIENLKLRN